MAEDIKKIIKQTARETAKEVRREFDLVIEDLEKGTLKAINEQLDSQNKQVTQIQKTLSHHGEKLDKIDTRLAVVETALESVNLPMLKQKVLGLEKRVDILESKLRPA